jgi:pimeloyl-ACP methyl ester carboxylesterase
MMKYLRYFLFLLLGLGMLYAVGPVPKFAQPTADMQLLTLDLRQLDAYIQQKEAKFSLKPDNEARIVWADSVRQTEYAVVYLHGLSACQEEGNPLHRDFAMRYGCNLYLSRLPMHGETNPDAFQHISPEALMEGAKEAIAIGKLLGKKVIIMGCSTGGTLGLYLAQNDPEIVALMLYSPNIDIANPASELLTAPWGQQIAELVSGGKYHKWEASPAQQAYWQTQYRIEGLSAVKSLVEQTMTPTVFQQVKQPVFMGYYYKDEKHQDEVVSVDAMLKFFDQLGTPNELKRKMSFPTAGAHVICGKLFSKDVETVKAESFKWAEEVLKLQAIVQ